MNEVLAPLLLNLLLRLVLQLDLVHAELGEGIVALLEAVTRFIQVHRRYLLLTVPRARVQLPVDRNLVDLWLIRISLIVFLALRPHKVLLTSLYQLAVPSVRLPHNVAWMRCGEGENTQLLVGGSMM